MDILSIQFPKFREIRNIIDSRNEDYFTVEHFNAIDDFKHGLSIVMTAHNRSKQVYFTLQTIENSKNKNIQIILIDDSTDDKVNPAMLRKFNVWITLISIKNEKKIWVNPCVNYNIGFSFIEGNKVIIQNSEVCHVGDVCEFIKNNLSDNQYLVFDVRAVSDFDGNEQVYKSYFDDDTLFFALNKLPIYRTNVNNGWYQHTTFSPRNYHFLTAITKNDLDKIGGFSLDYSFAGSYDDDDLIMKINYYNINIINIDNEKEKLGGIHLFHQSAGTDWENTHLSETLNRTLFQRKQYFANKDRYVELSSIEDKYSMMKTLLTLFSV